MLRGGEADGVGDLTGGHFVVADEAGQDGQAGGVGGGPARRVARALDRQVEHRPRAGVPASIRLRPGVPRLVEPAGVAVDDQHVSVAAAVRAALDGALGGIG